MLCHRNTTFQQRLFTSAMLTFALSVLALFFSKRKTDGNSEIQTIHMFRTQLFTMHLPWLYGGECAESVPLLFCFSLLKTVNQSWSQSPAYPWAGWEKFSVVESEPHLPEGTLREKQESIIPLTKILVKPCLKFSTQTFFIYLAHCHLSKTMLSKGQQDISSGQRCWPFKPGDLSL